MAFTDGLVERRGESIDIGLDRLAEAATVPAATLEDLLTSIIDKSAQSGAEDDIAVLAIRRRGPGSRPDPRRTPELRVGQEPSIGWHRGIDFQP